MTVKYVFIQINTNMLLVKQCTCYACTCACAYANV